jgi:mannose-6-phosphate isomerase-like protein (cupin superfamily)
MRIGAGLLLLSFGLVAVAISLLKTHGTVTRSAPEARDIVSQTRAITPEATHIVLSGSMNVTLRQGAVPSMIVRGEERLLGNVDTVQDGDTLTIGIKGMLLHHRQPLQVIVVLPELERLIASGSGDFEVNGFNGESVEVRLDGRGTLKFNGRYKQVNAVLHGSGDMEMNGGASDEVEVTMVGSGDMTVVGSAKEFRVTQTGSGDLDATHLAADNTEVSLQGSGQSTVQARKSVQVTLHGSGDVIVIGNPSERETERTGTGDIEFR